MFSSPGPSHQVCRDVSKRLAQVSKHVLQVDDVDGKVVKVSKNVLPCTLNDATKNLIKLIFSTDMFKEAMECMNLGG